MTVKELKEFINSIDTENDNLELVTDPTSPPIEGYNPISLGGKVINVKETLTNYPSFKKAEQKKVFYIALS